MARTSTKHTRASASEAYTFHGSVAVEPHSTGTGDPKGDDPRTNLKDQAQENGRLQETLTSNITSTKAVVAINSATVKSISADAACLASQTGDAGDELLPLVYHFRSRDRRDRTSHATSHGFAGEKTTHTPS